MVNCTQIGVQKLILRRRIIYTQCSETMGHLSKLCYIKLTIGMRKYITESCRLTVPTVACTPTNRIYRTNRVLKYRYCHEWHRYLVWSITRSQFRWSAETSMKYLYDNLFVRFHSKSWIWLRVMAVDSWTVILSLLTSVILWHVYPKISF